jgi:hypothetical protein
MSSGSVSVSEEIWNNLENHRLRRLGFLCLNAFPREFLVLKKTEHYFPMARGSQGNEDQF